MRSRGCEPHSGGDSSYHSHRKSTSPTKVSLPAADFDRPAGSHSEEPVIYAVPPTFPDTERPSAVLARVAEQLHRVLVGWSATDVEPTDQGYLYGYDLELRSLSGVIEHRQVFVEDMPSAGKRPGVLEIPVPGADEAITVWLYPGDPELPALRDLTDLTTIRRILARLSIPSSVTGVEVIAYRPGRRAVVRVTTVDNSFYVKVVEPGKAASIAERHQLFRASNLPVPKLLGWSADGIVAMSALPGVDAQNAVGRLKNIDDFLDQVEMLGVILADVPAFNTARPSLFNRLDWYVDRLSSRLPNERDRIATVGGMIARCGAEGRSYGHTPVTIHGDLHLGQLFVDPEYPEQLTGMLDIDTAGAGDPADDAAAFYAHVIALGEAASITDPAYAAACERVAAAWRARWQRNRNAGFASRAKAIAATHLLGHALRPLATDADRTSLRLLDHAESLVSDW
jgi:aminoglycoside phosphotransferase